MKTNEVQLLMCSTLVNSAVFEIVLVINVLLLLFNLYVHSCERLLCLVAHHKKTRDQECCHFHAVQYHYNMNGFGECNIKTSQQPQQLTFSN